MINRGHPGKDKVLLLLGDTALLLLCGAGAWYLRAPATIGASEKALSALVLLPVFLAALYVFDLYSLPKLNGLGTFVKAVVAVGCASVACFLLFHLFHWHYPSLRWLRACAVFLPPATYFWRRIYFHGSRHFRSPEELVVVGNTRDAKTLCDAMERITSTYHLRGMLHTAPTVEVEHEAPMPRKSFKSGNGAGIAHAISLPVSAGAAVAIDKETTAAVAVGDETTEPSQVIADLGEATPENLLRVVARSDIKAIVVRSDFLTSELAGVLTQLRFNGVQVYSLLDFCMLTTEELPLEALSEFWLCVADGFDLLQARFFRRLKRLTDMVLAAVGLLIASPIMVLAAVAIRLDSPGPVLFRQRRVGWMGHTFELLKFRSMRTGAEKDGIPQWAVENDPRVTRVGRFLRKTHLDEIPQMINVLRGEMSFVGPRPERPEFVGLLNEAISFYRLRHYVLPGITGWAQVNYPYGASLDDAKRKLQYDLYYICKASPLLDLRTLLRTARVVLFRQGSR